MSRSLDAINVPERTKRYLTDSVNPVLEELVMLLLRHQPVEPESFLYEYLQKKLGAHDKLVSEIERLKAALERVSCVSDDGLGDDSDALSSAEEFEHVEYGGRSRQAVSAEAYGDWNQKAEFVPPSFPKAPEARQHISELLAQSFLFASLEPSDLSVVLDAFELMQVEANSTVIREGDLGDFLCIVESGELACFKGSGVERKLVGVCKRGDVFGEMALLYNAPRAATVESVTACTLWRLDSRTFVAIVREGAAKKRERYGQFLKQVPLLAPVGTFELSQIADALVPLSFTANSTVVTEGEAGDTFYILESGSAEAWKQNQRVLTYVHPGEYFGELALLRQEPRAATVKAGIDGCRVLALDRNSFNRLLGGLEELTLRQYS